jgi:hypothetical protein
MTVDLDMQISCVRRELALREKTYPILVEGGSMIHAEAARELRNMKAVLATLESLRKPWDGVNRRNLHLQLSEELLTDDPATIPLPEEVPGASHR